MFNPDVAWSDYYVHVDPDLYPDGDDALLHRSCGQVLCTIQDGDDFGVLNDMIQDHAVSCDTP